MPSGIYNHIETKTPIYTLERNRKISYAQRGKKLPESHRKNIGKGHLGKRKPYISGVLSHFWKGGTTIINHGIRKTNEYKIWRKAILERDNYTCIWCGAKENLHVDHIKSFALFPELRLAIDNGRVLCFSCHKKTDSYLHKLKKL